MRLISFRIQNFKSIIDSKIQFLSIDNITGLIGQNESGKSSILEALNCFYDKILPLDYLRNDESYPVITCCFETTTREMELYLDKYPNKQIIANYIKTKNYRIEIMQEWTKDNHSWYHLLDHGLKEIIFESIVFAEGEVKSEIDLQIEKENEFIEDFSIFFPEFHLFEDNTSLLPNSIELDDVINNNTTVEGYFGVLNFLKVAKIDIEELITKAGNQGKSKSYIGSINSKITSDFQKFWSQKIGLNNKIEIEFELKYHDTYRPDLAGKPYLQFWVQDGKEHLHPKQRSKGVRWFLSFYLQLEADAISSLVSNKIYLIDEPGSSLHAKAQEDVLNVFEDLKAKIQIIYTTHSPYLIKFSNLYRYLGVQRSDEDNEDSSTTVISSHSLGAASTNTLAPILSCMGIDISHQNVIQKTNNVIVEEISAYYYLESFKKLLGNVKHFNIVPSTGVTNIQMLVYQFIGWGIDFIIVLDDDKSGRNTYNNIKKELYFDESELADKKMIKLKDCEGIEDIFSKSDFSKYVVKVENDSQKRNSEFVKNYSKGLLAAKFKVDIENNIVTIEDFEKETVDKIQNLVNKIVSLLPENEV